jgi:hypothetical protein
MPRRSRRPAVRRCRPSSPPNRARTATVTSHPTVAVPPAARSPSATAARSPPCGLCPVEEAPAAGDAPQRRPGGAPGAVAAANRPPATPACRERGHPGADGGRKGTGTGIGADLPPAGRAPRGKAGAGAFPTGGRGGAGERRADPRPAGLPRACAAGPDAALPGSRVNASRAARRSPRPWRRRACKAVAWAPGSRSDCERSYMPCPARSPGAAAAQPPSGSAEPPHSTRSRDRPAAGREEGRG